jgi:hypothetical protein
MEWSGRAPARQQVTLARGAKDKEHAMSSKLNTAIAVADIDIGKNSFHVSQWLRDPNPSRSDLMRRDFLARLNALVWVMRSRSLSNALLVVMQPAS